MSIRVTVSGSFDQTESFLRRLAKLDIRRILDSAGREGVAALASATPTDTGLAAGSWTYEIRQNKNKATIVWKNRNNENGFPVAIMLQYGYSTGTGGFVAGRDYINPAIRPVMDRLAADVWRAVTNG